MFFRFWLQDEPNDGGGNEDCIELNYQREQPGWSPLKSWNDRLCSDKIKGICENIGFVPCCGFASIV